MNTRKQHLEKIAKSGIVGAGGAGFPTHVKLDCKAETVIANGAECEPLMHKDKELMAAYAESVIKGMLTAIQITGAREGIIGLKGKAKTAIASLQKMIQPPIRLHILSDTYPAGDEFVLVYEATGNVVPAGGLPIHSGSVVINVETLFWIAQESPVVDKFVTIAGAVGQPATYRIPIGMRVRDVLLEIGFNAFADHGILAGGAMMGSLVTDPDAVITKTLGGLILLPSGHPLLRRYETPITQQKRIARSACDQCNFCTQLCPRYLLGHPVEPHLAMRHVGMAPPGAQLPPGSRYCCGCNLCSFWSCPEDLSPGTITFGYRQELMQNAIKKPLQTAQVHPLYEFRKPSISALKRRLGLDHFIDSAPLNCKEFNPIKVSIPLKQHTGYPAVATVKTGDGVKKGQTIGVMQEGKLGAAVHASINGKVTGTVDSIEIEAQ